MRKTLEAVLKADLADVSKWRTREMIATLANMQAKAADVMVYEAKDLADKAKLAEDF
jgi:hypothetical protein